MLTGIFAGAPRIVNEQGLFTARVVIDPKITLMGFSFFIGLFGRFQYPDGCFIGHEVITLHHPDLVPLIKYSEQIDAFFHPSIDRGRRDFHADALKHLDNAVIRQVIDEFGDQNIG